MRGFLNAIKTIIMLKIWSELPDMYIMIPVIGRLLTGAKATSQAFFNFKVSISSVVGAFRGWVFTSLPDFYDCQKAFGLDLLLFRMRTLPPVLPEKPGGSGMLAGFDLATGGDSS